VLPPSCWIARPQEPPRPPAHSKNSTPKKTEKALIRASPSPSPPVRTASCCPCLPSPRSGRECLSCARLLGFCRRSWRMPGCGSRPLRCRQSGGQSQELPQANRLLPACGCRPCGAFAGLCCLDARREAGALSRIDRQPPKRRRRGRQWTFVQSVFETSLLFERVEVGEVVGGEHFALHDREVDLGLVESAGVEGVWTRIKFLYLPCGV
jgi:hypothetical protein